MLWQLSDPSPPPPFPCVGTHMVHCAAVYGASAMRSMHMYAQMHPACGLQVKCAQLVDSSPCKLSPTHSDTVLAARWIYVAHRKSGCAVSVVGAHHMSRPLGVHQGLSHLRHGILRLRARARAALQSAAGAGLIVRGGSLLALSAAGAGGAAGDGNDPFKE